MATNEPVDGKYYEVVRPGSLGEYLTVAARNRIYRDFIRICRPTTDDTILDVGVSDVINDAANLVERKYPHQSQITALGLGQGTAFREAFPEISYICVEPNQSLPFDDQSFSVATSNAVLEHVGSLANQLAFVSELVRVARRVFITVPNRYFPIEHHTAVPLVHYWDSSFAVACRYLGKDEWSREANLILMSRPRLAALCPAGVSHQVGWTGIPLGPFSSSLFLFCEAEGYRS